MAKETKLRTVFMGTSDLSEVILSALIQKKYNLVGVFTKPDSKAGRKHEKVSPVVKNIAEKNKIPVFQPEKFNEEAVSQLKNLDPDIVIVAAYGKIIPEKALKIPKFGFLNVHASLLPDFRGPSPIQNALLAGRLETGVTIILMDKGIDTGSILAQESIKIKPSDNSKTLLDKLSELGSELLLRTIPLWIDRKIKPEPQNNSFATSCQLIEREDGHIFWTENAEDIYNRYRALTPWPGIFSYWKNNDDFVRIKLISVDLQKINPAQKHETGEVFELGEDIGVQTLSGVILLKEIQMEGKKIISAKEFVNGHPSFVGSILQ